MFPTRDVGIAVGPLAVADGQIHNLKVKFGGPENQIKIAEWVKIAKVGPVGGDQFIICF